MPSRPISSSAEPDPTPRGAAGAQSGEQHWDELAPALQELVRAARAAGVVFDDDHDDRPVEEIALLRMLGRAPQAGGEALLPVPLAGARIVCTVAEDAAVLTRALALLRAERGFFTVRLSDVEAVTVARNTPRRAGDDRALADCRAVTARLIRSGGVRIGVSAPVSKPDDVAAAYRDARDLTTLPGGAPVGFAEDQWASITIARLGRHVVDSLSAASPLTRLADYDAASGNSLTRTVAVWLAHDRDTIASAAALGIHVNTLRYRLRRAGAVSGLSLDDRRQRLVLELLLASEAPVVSG